MGNAEMLRVIVFQEDGQWVAQCLEYDICAHAPDKETLRDRFHAVFNFERNFSIERNGAPFAGIDAAPAQFHEMWDEGVKDGNIETSAGPVELKMCA